MKRFLIIAASVTLSVFLFIYLYFYRGVVYFPHFGEIDYLSRAEGKNLLIKEGDDYVIFDMKGVNMGLGKPGYYATEKAITKEEYLRWFAEIKDLGANVIRVYTLQGTEFYDAFYEFNKENDDPLYLIHGVWVDDYLINSSYSALDKEFSEPFLKNCKMMIDTVHGRHMQNVENQFFADFYYRDISPWVYGYILGIEWEGTLVAYTDNSFEQLEQFDGKYFYTEDASNFEIFLAKVGETVAEYETQKYGTQRTIAFANWATTDPLEYPNILLEYYKKCSSVDVEHIHCTEDFTPGQFASYHIYPYYPDYYGFLGYPMENTYLEYLKDINEHHTMPVVISEFGCPTSRGMAAREQGLGRNQGGMSEQMQGEALVSMYRDIKEAGNAGAIVFTWQDEWFKRTWNTMANVDLNATPYWSDYQTNEQYFGILSFDPGEEKSICYVDGDKSEWKPEHVVSKQDGTRLSMMYDERYLYFLVENEDYRIMKDKMYISIDTTPKSGAMHADGLNLDFDRNVDFVVELNGMYKSRVWVQERSAILEALFYDKVSPFNIFSKTFPDKNTDVFLPIHLLLVQDLYFERSDLKDRDTSDDRQLRFQEYERTNPLHYSVEENYETGKLTYGNGNPDSEAFNSLADFCAGPDYVEIRLPWQLLNFADPSEMEIHDDYYENFGVEYLHIDRIYVGAGDGTKEMKLKEFALSPLGRKPSYHERLKQSYYILQEEWK